MVLSAPIGPESPRAIASVVRSVRWTEWQRAASDWLAGQLALYRGRETQQSGVARRRMTHSAEPFPATDLRRGSRRGCGRLAAPLRPAKGSARQLPQQLAGEDDS